MRHSSERILTTHTGSLPRPKGLTELVFEKQEGKPSTPPLRGRRGRRRQTTWSPARSPPASTSSPTGR